MEPEKNDTTPQQSPQAQPEHTIIAAQPAGSPAYYVVYSGGTAPSPAPIAKNGKKKKDPVWAVVIIIVVVVLIIAFASIAYTISTFTGLVPRSSTETQSYKVIIGTDSFYKYTISNYYSSAQEIELNASSNGSWNFDVYIMTGDQFDNSYGNLNRSSFAFSALYEKENISRMSGKISLPVGNGDALYLVIDNTDNPLSTKDAVPKGQITVDFTITKDSSLYWD